MRNPAAESIDTTQTVEIRQQPGPVILLAAFFLTLFALCLFPIWMLWGRPDLFQQFATWLALAGGVFFAALTLAALKRARLGQAVVVRFSPQGYQYTVRSERVVPWHCVTSISAHHGRGAHLRLGITDDIAEKLRPNGVQKQMIHLGRRLGLKSWQYAIRTSPVGLGLEVRELTDLARAYARAHGKADL